jgi:hypothetical protein
MQLLIISLWSCSSSFLFPGHLLALSTALQWTPSIRALVLAPMLVAQLCCEDPVARLDAVGAVAARSMHIPLGVVIISHVGVGVGLFFH